MFSGGSSWREWPWAGLVLMGMLLAGVAGCGETNPFEMTPVSGKITYEDNTLIPAVRIRVDFLPQGESIGKIPPKPGKADVDVTDGTFTHVTTHKFNDGLIGGRHRVTAVSYDAEHRSTNLEIVNSEIEIGGEEATVEIKVKRP